MASGVVAAPSRNEPFPRSSINEHDGDQQYRPEEPLPVGGPRSPYSATSNSAATGHGLPSRCSASVAPTSAAAAARLARSSPRLAAPDPPAQIDEQEVEVPDRPFDVQAVDPGRSRPAGSRANLPQYSETKPVKSSRDRDDDLAACVSCFDVLQSCRGVGQWVGPVDDGSEGAGVDQFAHGEQVVPAPRWSGPS